MALLNQIQRRYRQWLIFHYLSTKKGLHSFLGLVGYYRNYIRDFAAIAQPLTDLLQKSKPNQIVWTENEVTAFKALKNAMIHAPVLKKKPRFS